MNNSNPNELHANAPENRAYEDSEKQSFSTNIDENRNKNETYSNSSDNECFCEKESTARECGCSRNKDERLDKEQVNENKRWHDALKKCPDSQNTVTVLNNVIKNVTMAFDSVNAVIPYVKNERFEELLDGQAEKYHEFIMRGRTLAEDMNVELEPGGRLSQSWASLMIKMKLMMNNSTSRIAEMMIQGTTMGIIDLGRLLRHTPDVLPKTLDLAREVMEFEEDKIEILKFYL